ncbi:MAG: pentapeptide repeat-containing protein, partial [Mycobacterium sp.]|nr:pentapeptide repeat-containing protein [Mycobacterium sp.]
NLSDAQLTNQANLKGAKFVDGVDLQRAHLNGATLTGATFSNNVNLTGADLTGAHLEGATFTSANLTDAILTGAHLDGATITNSNLTGAMLNGARLSGTSFSNANLTKAVLTGATVTASQAYPSATRFEAGTQLAGATFGNVDLSGVSFDHADLRGFTLAGSVGTPPASFTDVRVGPAGGVCTTFPDQNLFALTLTIATADTGCEPTPMFPGSLLRLEQIPPNLWSSVSMGGAYLYVDAANRSTLSGANLANAHLDGMVVVGVPADLTRTVFDNASLQQAHLELADFAGASLKSVHAHQASFHGARFIGHDGLEAATFQKATLTDTNFVAADISEANFVGADLSDAAFNRVRARSTNFNGVTARNTVFNSAHIYDNGEAFDQATDLMGIDFSNAVLAASADDASGGFNFTSAPLVNAKFDGAQCISCNFTSARLNGASFSRAYLVGAILTNAVLESADFDDAWLYCGDQLNSACTAVQGPMQLWSWPLDFGAGEGYGPVAFPKTVVSGVSFSTVNACPDGNRPDETTGGCDSLLPNAESAPQVPPSGCSASALDVCPLRVSTLAGGEDEAKPVVATPAAPPAWATSLPDDGTVLDVTDDGALRSVRPPDAPVIIEEAGTFHAPSGIAVGVDGSIWVADGGLVRIAPDRKTLDPIDIGSNVTANDVWVDPLGQAWIATPNGVIMRAVDGSMHPLPLADFPSVHITGDSLGNLWVTTHAPDHLVRIAPDGTVAAVVGTGYSGYNGNQDQYGFLPGKQVQVNQPGGLAVGLDGIVYFADTANNLLRGYRPDNDHVIEVGGLIGDDGPVGGFNGDNCWSSQTRFSQPQDIAVTLFGTFVVADSANDRLRQFGYPPANPDRPATSDCESQP